MVLVVFVEGKIFSFDISFSEWAISFQKVPLLHWVCLYGCKALGQGRKGLHYHLVQALISVRPLSSGFYPTQQYLVSWIMAPDE